MVKRHLKRLNVPKNWGTSKKGLKYILRPIAGPHTTKTSMPLGVIMRDMLGHVNTMREARNILQNRNILINGIRRKEPKFPVGLFDVIEIQETKEYFRIILDEKGKISLLKTDKSDSEVRLCRVIGKRKLKGKKCDKCSADMEIRHGKYGSFLGCSNYPKCKNIQPLIKFTGVKCPRCKKGQLVERRARKTGKVFYGCNQFPRCKFATWDKPLVDKCKKCGGMLVEKKDEVVCLGCSKDSGKKKETK